MANIENQILDSMKASDGGLFGGPETRFDPSSIGRTYGASPSALIARGNKEDHVNQHYPETVNVKDINTMHDFTIQKGDIWSHEKETNKDGNERWVQKEEGWLTDKNGRKIKGKLLGSGLTDWLYNPKRDAPQGVKIVKHGEGGSSVARTGYKRDRVTIQAEDGSQYEMGYKAYLETLE
jgi:hypothetical protein